MRRCPGCGGFFAGDACPNEHTDVFEPLPLRAALLSQGDWATCQLTIGAGDNAVEVSAPALVLGVSSEVVRLACFVAESGRVVICDAAFEDVQPAANPLEETTDGD